MKRRVLLLMIGMILAAAFCVMPVLAAGSGTASLSASGSCKAGETVTLTVQLKGASGVNGIAVTPTYDSSIFELTAGSWKVSGIMADFSVSNGDGVIAFAEGVSLNGTILTFTLKVKPNVAAGKYTVGCSVVVSTTDGAKDRLTASTSVTVDCTHQFTVENPSAQYLKSAATCTSPALYYHSCKLCGAKGNTTFKHGQVLDHKFDQKNTASQYIHTPADCQTAAVYYYSCVCGLKGSTTFVGSDPDHSWADGWKTDGENHWHACTACGDIRDQAAHIPGPEATTENPQVCTVCQYVLVPAKVHVHDYTVRWYSDADAHWGECECSELSQAAEHVWDAGVTVMAPTATEEGILLHTCKDCGRIKTVAIPADPSATEPQDPEPEPTKPTDVPAPTQPNGDVSGTAEDKNGSFVAGSLVGLPIGLLIGLGAAIVVLRKRKENR